MAIQVQIRRGTNKENNAFTGAQGEVTVNTINNSLRIHDGETVGGHIVLGESQITNCITEIPQDIKLELNNGTLTLKAESKVYKPNGAGVFDTVTIANDRLYQFGSRTGTYLIYNSADFIDLTNNVSGATDPKAGVAWHIWYDTINNLIKLYGDDASTPLYNLSFPVGVATVSSGVVTSVQTFNGFGYIGSSVFALPNIKWLTADGRNADGTLKNVEHTNTTVLTTYYPYNDNLCFILTSISVFTAGYYVQSETEPTTQYTIWYKPSENILRTKSTGDWSVVNDRIAFARSQTSTTGIKSFSPIQAFHVVDYNDAVLKNMNQDIIGGKYFSGNIYKKMTSYAYTETPSTQTFNSFYGADKDNEVYGAFEFIKNTDGSNAAQMNIKGINGSWTSSPLGIGVTSTGNTFTYAPTPTSVYSNNNAIATTEHIIAVLDKIYPIGALYIGTTSTCPLAAFFGTWELVEYGNVLQTGNGTVGNWSLVNTSNTGAWNVVAPSLPNTTGVFDGIPYTAAWNATNVPMSGSGALYNAGGSAGTMHITTSQGANQNVYKLGLNLSSSSSYYSNTDTRQPVQPRALVVNVWRRTA